jgi:acyl transferase domain-containing protein/SAM-dependent methyltransferase/NAD(P)-dependent dehydrogenase (short-subunit alcohol dehydrogenase family)/acyl carrier protein
MTTPFHSAPDDLSPLKRAILTIEELKARLARVESPVPIAVIGIGCRFPGGVNGPEAFWRLLMDGRSGIVETPSERWNSADWYDPDRSVPGKMNMRRAGFLADGIDRFDAGFFSIAPREATSMDPQQRLLLEVAWETLENAALAPDRVKGANCGVFVGLYYNNYALTGRGSPAPEIIDGWSASGSHTSIAAGRLSYLLDLKGPCLAVDTACSSSLVAVHLAVRSLQSGECNLALAGGVHLLLAPEALVASTKLGATAPDGRCKAFDVAADGFGHGEGCGLVALKRLPEALADGDRVLAIIHGSAVNQDGRSNSLTAPNGPSQEAVIRAALVRAGIAPRLVSYVEAHGTGTPLGDPIEIEALSAALGAERDTPLIVGSVKTNIGHLEAAAGVAGLIKAVLCVEHGMIPPHLNFTALNPEIDPEPARLMIPTQPMAWEGVDGRRIAGVSAFGFGGTNAHLVLESPPLTINALPLLAAQSNHPGAPRHPSLSKEGNAQVLPLSARDPQALTELVARWVDWLEATSEPFAAIAQTASAGRNHFAHRLAVTASNAGSAAVALRRAAPVEVKNAPRIAFLFTGQGSQYPGMARRAYECFPVFRAALDRYAGLLDAPLGRSALDLLFGEASIDPTGFAQPLVVAVELALVDLWRSWGITPVAVMGHSVGEYAAAVVAGVFTPEEALALVAERGRLMQALPAGGGMLAVFAPVEAVEPWLTVAGGVLDLAGFNGPANTVVSGDLTALDQLAERLDARGIDSRRLAVSHAFHSALLEPALPGLEQAARGYGVRYAHLPLISNLTGTPRETFDAGYWREHARRPVRFVQGLEALRALGCDTFLEIGPQAILTALGKAALDDGRWLTSLRRGVADDAGLAEALAGLYQAGATIDWAGVFAGTQPGWVAAPTYPFQRRRYWLDLKTEKAIPNRADLPPLKKGGGGDFEQQHAMTFKSPLPPFAKGGNFISGNRPTSQGSALVYDFYDELTVVSRTYEATGAADLDAEGHLTFGFLPEPVPGFSWVRALFEKDENPEAHALFRASQRELKDSLFVGIDFSRMRRVFDYGCGHAADLCSLALHHPQLELQGYTLSARQVEVGTERIARLGLQDRVRVQRNDSSAVPFPGQFDLIFGFEVTGLIADKEALFDNIAAHLAPGGLLVIADFVATADPIANPQTHSFTPDFPQWAALFGNRRLRLTRAVDTSLEIANWLEDPQIEANVAALAARFGLGELTCRHLLSNANIGKALRMDVMRYLLLTAQAAPHEEVAALREANEALLRNARPLATTLQNPPGFATPLSERGKSPPTPPFEKGGSGGISQWRHWLYGIDWLTLPNTEPLPTPTVIADALAPDVAREKAALQPFAAAGVTADRLSLDYTVAAFRALGCADVDAAAQVEIAPPFRRLRDRLVAVMKAAGLHELPDPGDPDARAAEALARHPEAEAEFTLLRRCGGALSKALTGQVDPLELLFPGGDIRLAERLYEHSPFSQAVQRLAGQAVARLSRTQPLAVLEIGGGSGATTAHLLPHLPPGSRYLFTDLGAGLVARAQDKFTGAGLDYAVLDIVRPPEGQGIAAGVWDVVVAANVLHATPDLARTLGHVRELLTPGGLLLLIENTGRLNWGDLTFGLTDGMWNFTDTGLRDYALLYQSQWRELLPRCGFEQAAILTPGEPDQGGLSQQCVILARRNPRRHWLLVNGPDEFAAPLFQALAVNGDRCTGIGELPDEPDELLADVSDVVYLGAVEATDPLQQDRVLAPALALAKTLMTWTEPPRLTFVTCGAQAVGNRLQPAQATLLGFGRALMSEVSELHTRLIDLDPAGSIADQVAALTDELTLGREREVARRGGVRRQSQLVRRPAMPVSSLHFDSTASYLVTGAFGGLGLKVAGWLVEHGAKTLVLAGRNPPSPEAEVVLDGLRNQGVRVLPVCCDVADRDQVQALIAAAQEAAPLKGVIHAAGALADASLAGQSWEKFERVLAAKVLGSWHLHELTAGLDLEHFVLFSSAAGLLGPAGQTNHAAANSFIDALAHARRASGLPALAIDWGAWAEVGAAVRDDLEARVERTGLIHMAPESALAALAWAMSQSAAQIAILDADWAVYRQRFPLGGIPPLTPNPAPTMGAGSYTTLAPNPSPKGRGEPGSTTWQERLAAAPTAQRLEVLMDAIRAEAARIMRLDDEGNITDERPLRDLGLDSLMAVEMRNALAARIGVKLPATLLFDQPSVSALAAFLAGGALAELFPVQPDAGAESELAGLDAAALSALLDAELGVKP